MLAALSFEPASASSTRVDSVNPVYGVYVCEPCVPASYIMMSLMFWAFVFSSCCLSMTVTAEGMSPILLFSRVPRGRVRSEIPLGLVGIDLERGKLDRLALGCGARPASWRPAPAAGLPASGRAQAAVDLQSGHKVWRESSLQPRAWHKPVS